MIAVALKTFSFSWWWVAALVPMALVSVWMDKKHIAPGEQEAATRINPEWNRFMKEFEELKKRVDAL